MVEPFEKVSSYRSIAGVRSEKCSPFKCLRHFAHKSRFARIIGVYSQTVGLCRGVGVFYGCSGGWLQKAAMCPE